MKSLLLKKLPAILIALTLFTVFANAQIVYTDVNPDKTFTCSKIGCTHQYNLI